MRTLLILLALALPLVARAAAPEPHTETAVIKVHNHPVYTLRGPIGPRTPAVRASEASANLTAAIDDDFPGDIAVIPGRDFAEVKLGDRLMFRITTADADLGPGTTLTTESPHIQAELQRFVDKARRRATLQKGVLGLSLAVFFAVVLWVLLRAFFRATRAFEVRLLRGDALPVGARALGITDVERSRGTILFLLSGVRIAVSLGTIYVFLLASLSLFQTTRAARNWLALSAAAPFRALLDRLVLGLPNLVLMVVVLAVMRGGWRAMTVGFARMGRDKPGGLLRPHQVRPARVLARVALVVGGLMVLPFALGNEGGLFNAVGLVLLGAVGLAALPLLANVGVGLYAMFTDQYAAGRWIQLHAIGGQVSGEVTSVDAFHLHLVPERGGEIRVPHLVALWSSVTHLPGSRGVSVVFPVARRVPAERAIAVLRQAAAGVAQSFELASAPEVMVQGITPEVAHFCVDLPEAGEAVRTPLLLALDAAIRPLLLEPLDHFAPKILPPSEGPTEAQP